MRIHNAHKQITPNTMYKVIIQGTQEHITAKSKTTEFGTLTSAQQYFDEVVYSLNIDEDKVQKTSDGEWYTRGIGQDYVVTIESL